MNNAAQTATGKPAGHICLTPSEVQHAVEQINSLACAMSFISGFYLYDGRRLEWSDPMRHAHFCLGFADMI